MIKPNKICLLIKLKIKRKGQHIDNTLQKSLSFGWNSDKTKQILERLVERNILREVIINGKTSFKIIETSLDENGFSTNISKNYESRG